MLANLFLVSTFLNILILNKLYKLNLQSTIFINKQNKKVLLSLSNTHLFLI